MKKITNVEALKGAIAKGHNEYFITLNGGLRSSKYLSWDGKKFYILNYIDSTEQWLTEGELFEKGLTNIGKAMNVGAFWCYDSLI